MGEVIELAVDLDKRALAAKQSDEEMEQLILDFNPFFHSRAAKHSIHYDQRDELFSIISYAFYESIKSYDVDKGHFFPFMSKVVRLRIIDYIRKANTNELKTIQLEDEEDEPSSAQSAVISEISMRSYEEERRRKLVVDEIEQLKEELTSWGITMASLYQQSPKHDRLRRIYKTVVSKIMQNPDIMQTIQVKRYFPIKAISKISGLPQKNLERARTFILASLIIKMGDYDILSDYVDNRGQMCI